MKYYLSQHQISVRRSLRDIFFTWKLFYNQHNLESQSLSRIYLFSGMVTAYGYSLGNGLGPRVWSIVWAQPSGIIRCIRTSKALVVRCAKVRCDALVPEPISSSCLHTTDSVFVKFLVWFVKHLLYKVYSGLLFFSIFYTALKYWCTLYDTQCTMHIAQCYMYSVHCILYRVYTVVYNVYCIVYTVVYTV